MVELNKPKILHVISHLALGGAEEVAVTICEQLSESFDFRVFAVLADQDEVGAQFAQRLEAVSIPVHTGTNLKFKSGGLLQASWKLRETLQEWSPAAVHLHTEIPEATFALASRLPRSQPTGLSRKAVLRTIHNSTIWPAWRRLGALVEQQLLFARVAAVSQVSLEGLWNFQRSHQLLTTPPHACRVIYNGVRPPTLKVVPSLTSGEPIKILFAARFEPQKGVDLLPQIIEEAARLTPERHVEVHLVGSGGYENELRTWAATQQTGWAVKVDPPLARISERFGEFHALLMPSRFEGLPLLGIEALFAGLPVVTTIAPGVSEVFDPTYPFISEAGKISGMASQLARVISDPESARLEVQPWQEIASQRFNVNRMVEEYHREYLDILHGR